MSGSRTKNSVQNVYAGLINKMITSILPFIVRTAMIYVIGEKYLGLNSLFSSILQVLSLSELGFTEAITYSLYKPISENDKGTICRYLSFFKKTYRIIGIIIFGIGVVLIPVLPLLVNGEIPTGINITLVYLIFLINTVLSYLLFAYKNVLFVAFQRVGISNNIDSGIYVIQTIFQIVVIILFRNYYYYLLIMPVLTILKNILISKKADKIFNDIRPSGYLDSHEKASIFVQIKGIMIGKLSDVSRNSFDSIILTSYLGLTACAVYGNYYYVYVLLYSILLIIGRSVQASVGDSILKETIDKNLRDFKNLSFFMIWINTIMAALMLTLYQDFMIWWVGKDLILSELEMILFVIYFHCISLTPIRNMYLDSNALWWKARKMFVLEATGNLALNIVLCKLIGLKGILLATISTIFIFNLLGRSYILYKEYFGIKNYKEYLKSIVLNIIISLFVCFLCLLISKIIDVKVTIVSMLLKGLVTSVISIVILWMLTHRKEEYIWMKNLLLKIIKRP